MNKLKYIILSLLVFLVFNCKSAKTISGGEANFKLSTKQLLKENSKQTPVFNTLQSKLKITYNQDGNEQSYTVNFRAKKDEMLWISATFSIVKALVTPEKVSFYNKLDNTYFEGDYKYLSDLLGTELDFQKVQDLLLGQSLLDLKKESFDISFSEKNYQLKPKISNPLFDILFLINPINFKINSQQLNQKEENNTLVINYANYETIENEFFPREIYIIASDKKNTSTIDVDYKTVEFNKSLSFPFEIPKNYEKIELK